MKNIDYAELVKSLIRIVVDSLEEFFEVLVAPTASFTKDAFLVSLGFTAFSLLTHYLDIISFVSWQEAVTASVLMLVVVFIDSSSRSKINNGLSKLKESVKAINIHRSKFIKEEGVEDGTTNGQRSSEFSDYDEADNSEITS